MDGIPLRSDHPCELASTAVQRRRYTYTQTFSLFTIKPGESTKIHYYIFFYVNVYLFILLIGCNFWYSHLLFSLFYQKTDLERVYTVGSVIIKNEREIFAWQNEGAKKKTTQKDKQATEIEGPIGRLWRHHAAAASTSAFPLATTKSMALLIYGVSIACPVYRLLPFLCVWFVMWISTHG